MKKLLSLLVASSFAFYMQACSDATSADDDEIDLVSSSSDGDASSSSKAKSSSTSVCRNLSDINLRIKVCGKRITMVSAITV